MQLHRPEVPQERRPEARSAQEGPPEDLREQGHRREGRETVSATLQGRYRQGERQLEGLQLRKAEVRGKFEALAYLIPVVAMLIYPIIRFWPFKEQP
jgi:hypothetical protein